MIQADHISLSFYVASQLMHAIAVPVGIIHRFYVFQQSSYIIL